MWNVKRRQQITDLEDLLRGIAMLDKSTGVFTHMPEMIRVANDLLKSDIKNLEKNFTQFITEEALKNE